MIRRRLQGQDGFALVASVAILFILLALAAAASTATISARGQGTRSTSDVQALQAADAAANIGQNRINLVHLDSVITVTTPCLSWDVSGVVTAVAALAGLTSGWCPSNSVNVPGAGSASYQYSLLTLGTRYVVGTATVGGVTRRVELTLNSSGQATSLFQSYGLISLNQIDMQNQTSVSGAGIRSNAGIKLEDTAAPCHVSGGSITPGPGFSVTYTNNASNCGNSTAAAGTAISLPAATVPSTDDDSRICTSLDPCTGGSDASWSSTKKRLVLQNSATLTLTGNNYTFCYMDLKTQTHLVVHPSNGQPVHIYFLSPATCTLLGGMNVGDATQLWFENQSIIDNQTSLGAAGVQFLLAGGLLPTSSWMRFDSSSTLNADFYGPSSMATLENQAIIKGAIAVGGLADQSGNMTGAITGSAKVIYDSTSSTVTGGTTGGLLYASKAYVQCPATTGSTPDANCP